MKKLKIWSLLLPLQRKPCNRAKINFVSICRRQFSLTAVLIFFVLFWGSCAWKKTLPMDWQKASSQINIRLWTLCSVMSRCIWKVTSRPLIWSNFVYMNGRYGIFKLFSIFFNFLLTFVSQAVSFKPLDRIQFSTAYFHVLF